MARNQDRIPPIDEGRYNPGVSRVSQLRRDDDTVKTPKVSLYDIDYAMLYEIGEKMRIVIPEKGRMIDVPVIYADGETWSQIRGRGYLRDEKKRIMAPVIALRRTNVTFDDRIPIVSLNLYSPGIRYYPYKTRANQYDRFGNQIDRKPSTESYLNYIPSFVRVSYDVMIWTDLIEQMNIIVQTILGKSGFMWGDFYTFRTNVDDASMNTSNNAGQDRIVSSTMTLTVDGYLRDEFEYQENLLEKAISVKKVKFDNEREEFEFYTVQPTIPNNSTHVKDEPYHMMQRIKKRNLRHR